MLHAKVLFSFSKMMMMVVVEVIPIILASHSVISCDISVPVMDVGFPANLKTFSYSGLATAAASVQNLAFFTFDSSKIVYFC